MTKSQLIFVIITILIVFGISWYQLKDGERKTRDAQRKSDVELVARKLGEFYSDHNFYPDASPSGQIISCGLLAQFSCKWGQDPIIDADEVVYMPKLPDDPQAYAGQKYMYTVSASRGNFKIYVALERKQDQDIRKDLTIECGNGVQCNWYVEK